VRSLGYVLRGTPANTADCLDYALRHPLQRIILALQTPVEINEQYEVQWLKGSFVWFFEHHTAVCEVTFGGCFRHEPVERQRRSVDNANDRLQHELQLIAAGSGVTVEGSEQRFDPALAVGG
jgi:hypothetical protein